MFLPLTVCKLTQQRLRGSWGQSTEKIKRHINSHSTINHHRLHSFYWKESVEKGTKFFPTQSSRGYLDKLPIKVGDDGITLLRCVHPDGGGEDKTTMTHH